MSRTHSYIVLPVHPPEVNDSVWQRALSCNICLWAIHTLKGEMGTKGEKATLQIHIFSKGTSQGMLLHFIIKPHFRDFYLDEVSIDIICVLIGCFQTQFHPAVINCGEKKREKY